MKAPAKESGFLVQIVVNASFAAYNNYLILINWCDKFREMTCCVVVTPLFRFIDGFNLATDLLCHRTTCMKATTRGNVDWTWQIARKNDTLATFLNLGIRDRHCRKQSFGIRMLGSSIQLISVSKLNNSSQVHDC